MLWINGSITEPQYYWVLGNLREDEKEKYALIKNVVEILHSRLRPETYKSKEQIEQETTSAPNGEFEELVNMSV